MQYKHAVKRTLSRQRQKLASTYAAFLKRDPSLAGTVKLSVLIGADGSAQKARRQGGTLRHEAMVRCLIRLLERIVYPKPKDGKPVRLTFTLTFAS